MTALVRWLRGLTKAARAWWLPTPHPVRLAVVDDEPALLLDDILYVVGGDDPMYAVMTCPCGCEAPLRMNVRPEADPRWRWSAGPDGSATLRPSVWSREGCRSHFFLSCGRIEWCIP